MFEHARLLTFAQMNVNQCAVRLRRESLLTSVLHMSVVKLNHGTPAIAFLTSDVTPSTICGSTVSVMYLLLGREYLGSSVFKSLVNPSFCTMEKGWQSIAIISLIHRWIWYARASLISHTCVHSLFSLIVSCLAFAEVVGWSSCASNDFCLCFSYSRYTTWCCVFRWLTRFEVL